MLSVCLCPPSLTPKPICIKLVYHGTWVHLNGFINPSHQSVCLYVHPLIVARKLLGKNVTAATNTHATIELLDASFFVRSMVCQRRVDDYFFPGLLVL
jgi:hypothetical protein